MIEFLGTKNSVGLFCIVILGNYAIHFFPQDKIDKFWGKRTDWCDGECCYFGLGQLLLITWIRD